MIKKRKKSISVEKTDEITLTVDYSRSLQEMIEAAKFDWTNDQITEDHFPLPAELKGKKVEISAKPFYFDRRTSSKYAISEMDKDGFRPASPAEILALAEAYPEMQKEFPIVALGSVWRDGNGFRRVLVLDFCGRRRRLFLNWFGRDWYDVCRFLGVRK